MNPEESRAVEAVNSNSIKGAEISNFQTLAELSPVAMCFFAEDFTILAANSIMLDQWNCFGKIPANLSEVYDVATLKLISENFQNAEALHLSARKTDSVIDGINKTFYFDQTFKNVKNDAGNTIAVALTSTDVTSHLLAQISLDNEHRQLLSYFHESPVALAIIDTEDLIFRLANPFYGELIGRDSESIINRSFLEVIPELVGQGFDVMFREVMASGIPFNEKEAPVTLIRNSKMETFYVNLTCSPRYNDKHEICGVSIVATDTTEQVLQRNKAEEVSRSLQGAIELANLGTYSIDLETGISEYSERLRDWFGFNKDEIITQDKAFFPVVEKDRIRIKNSISAAVNGESSGIYDVIYTIVNPITQEKRILHAQGQTILNDKKEPVRIDGTTSDITVEKNIQKALKKQVRQRTEELAFSNQQLEEANQQMTATLEKLESSNANLLRSNSELSQYAYIASHDLQEPLRKIRMYSGLLEDDEDLSERNRKSILKISNSSARMSMLITDLLEYSKLIKSEKMLRPVDLNSIVSDVVNDFELIISEKKAEIEVAQMPMFNAIALQMNQLFYNLIGNALKFNSVGNIPKITVGAQKMLIEDVEKHIAKPLPETDYYDIFIRDNGIGFDVRYSDQIFEVFKRLHPKDIYPGSGIGLALCRSIVNNHEGYLFVESEIGKGSTFHIVMPSLKNI